MVSGRVVNILTPALSKGEGAEILSPALSKGEGVETSDVLFEDVWIDELFRWLKVVEILFKTLSRLLITSSFLKRMTLYPF